MYSFKRKKLIVEDDRQNNIQKKLEKNDKGVQQEPKK